LSCAFAELYVQTLPENILLTSVGQIAMLALGHHIDHAAVNVEQPPCAILRSGLEVTAVNFVLPVFTLPARKALDITSVVCQATSDEFAQGSVEFFYLR
tara:strand:- start:2441 stop:2737 length:297 start_codon:yes stop_codon:yes gene_type:complete